MTETPLIGGRTTLGLVRVGETVRRPPVMNSDFAHCLLRHLEAVGFDGVPRSLGVDAKGRDVLSWIEGVVPAELSAAHNDAMLADAAMLIRCQTTSRFTI